MSTNGIKTYLTDHDIDSLSSETLTTEDKTLVGAINELTEMSSDMTVVDDGDGNIILGADATTIVVPKNSNEIDYDNTESGLIATNVQGAIDEIGASLNTLNSNLEDAVMLASFTSTGDIEFSDSLKNYKVIFLVATYNNYVCATNCQFTKGFKITPYWIACLNDGTVRKIQLTLDTTTNKNASITHFQNVTEGYVFGIK